MWPPKNARAKLESAVLHVLWKGYWIYMLFRTVRQFLSHFVFSHAFFAVIARKSMDALKCNMYIPASKSALLSSWFMLLPVVCKLAPSSTWVCPAWCATLEEDFICIWRAPSHKALPGAQNVTGKMHRLQCPLGFSTCPKMIVWMARLQVLNRHISC